MITIDEQKMQDYFDNQHLQPEIVSALEDLSAATGWDFLKMAQGFISCANGNNDQFKKYGIDPTGVVGFYERINFLIAEIKAKFSTP